MRVRGLLALAAVGVVVLSGCSDPQEAHDTLPTATTSTAGPSATLEPLGPVDFPVPDEAREQTPEAVAVFATYYLDLADYLLATLESQPLRDLSQGCEACNQLADGYDTDRVAGNVYEGGDLSIASIGIPTVQAGRADVSLLLQQSEVVIRDAAGATISQRSSPATQLSGGMAFIWDPGIECWLVTQLTAERV